MLMLLQLQYRYHMIVPTYRCCALSLNFTYGYCYIIIIIQAGLSLVTMRLHFKPVLTRHLSRAGDYFVSLDLADGYYTLGIREEDRDLFTVNYRGALWRLACLPMGWSGSAYYFCKLT
jgi:hypothetical protein